MNANIQMAIEQITLEDQSNRTYRAKRLQDLRDEGLPKRIYLSAGAWEITFAFHEAVTSYVNGTFVGCVLLSQACLQQILADHLTFSGEKGLANKGFKEILTKALEKGLITEPEFCLFDDLRKRRNPYTHYRSLVDKNRLAQRAMASDETMVNIMAEDAKKAILSLIHICHRPPFAEPYSEQGE